MTSPWARALLAVSASAAAGVALRFHETVRAAAPPCPVYTLTGVYCPGCGSGRAFSALAEGQLAAAAAYNPLAVLTAATVAVLALRWVWRGAAPWPAPAGWRVAVSTATPVVVLAYTLARNVPASPLAPGAAL